MSGQASAFRVGTVSTGGHVTAYLERGPQEGQPVILVHGWPETSWSWRHQITSLAARGYRVIAPDLRGTGQSTVYTRHQDYALRHHVGDMIALADGLGIERASWIGHDWGAPIVWTTARRHPERFVAVGALSTPYDTLERGFERMVSFVRRDVYPEHTYPAGQLDYFLFYRDNFQAAQEQFEADLPSFFAAVMRSGEPGEQNEPFFTANVRAFGGWFGGGRAPRVPIDERVIDETDLKHLVDAYGRTGFFGINSLYMNDADNRDLVESSGATQIDMPTLFIGGRWDYVNDATYSRLADPMRALCTNLDYRLLDAGHWIHHECRDDVTDAIDAWLGGVLRHQMSKVQLGRRSQ